MASQGSINEPVTRLRFLYYNVGWFCPNLFLPVLLEDCSKEVYVEYASTQGSSMLRRNKADLRSLVWVSCTGASDNDSW